MIDGAGMDARPRRRGRCPLGGPSIGRQIRVFAPLRGLFAVVAVRVFALFSLFRRHVNECSVFLRFVVVKVDFLGGNASKVSHKMLRFFPPSASSLSSVSPLYTASSVQKLVF